MRLIMPPHIDPLHPIATQEYAVYTPPINELVETIGDWINRMESGGYIYAPPRYGKSRGIKWFVRSALEERFKTFVPLVIWVRRTDMQVTEIEFWRELLFATRFEFLDHVKRPDKVKLRSIVLNRMTTIARSAESNYVALVIDEAHDMTIKEWRWLLGLQNQLDFEGIRLSVISIGTQQMGYQHDFLAKTGNAHLSARFLVLHSPFHGLREVDELKYVLHGYDLESEWPSKSGISYFRYFSPNSYQAGHRLTDFTENLWQVFIDLAQNSRRPRSFTQLMDIGIPMKHVALCVEEILWRLSEGKDWEDVTSFDSLAEIVVDTRYIDTLSAITMTA